VTGIEPALSAWESVPSGPVAWSDLRISLSASGRERPLFTGVNGPLMARRSSSTCAGSRALLPLLDSYHPTRRDQRGHPCDAVGSADRVAEARAVAAGCSQRPKIPPKQGNGSRRRRACADHLPGTRLGRDRRTGRDRCTGAGRIGGDPARPGHPHGRGSGLARPIPRICACPASAGPGAIAPRSPLLGDAIYVTAGHGR
jgi:hypothetical protein